MIESALRTLLVAAVGRTALPPPGFAAASRTAIALSAIAVRANPEQRPASRAPANPLPQNNFSMNRHPPMQADFDNGNRSCQGRTSLHGDLLVEVAEPEPRRSNGGVLLPPSPSQYKFSLECFDADD
jgi:hypothetical protein